LLRLTAELRNTIYELTLTAPRSLHHRKPDAVGKKPCLYLHDVPGDNENPIEYNQLKYVNKQLYAETAGLELKFNDITFSEGSGYALPSQALIDWVSSMSIAKRSWIKIVSIRSDRKDGQRGFDDESVDAVARFTQLCNDIPTMKVKYYKPFWTLANHQTHADVVYFFVVALSTSYKYRGEGIKYLLFDASEQVMLKECAKNWRETDKGPNMPLAQLQAKNLKYFPDMPTDAPVSVIKADYTVAKDGKVIPEAEQWIGNK